MTPRYELRDLDAMNIIRLWMVRMTSGGELRVLDVMNSSGLYMT